MFYFINLENFNYLENNICNISTCSCNAIYALNTGFKGRGGKAYACFLNWLNANSRRTTKRHNKWLDKVNLKCMTSAWWFQDDSSVYSCKSSDALHSTAVSSVWVSLWVCVCNLCMSARSVYSVCSVCICVLMSVCSVCIICLSVCM